MSPSEVVRVRNVQGLCGACPRPVDVVQPGQLSFCSPAHARRWTARHWKVKQS